MLRHQEHPCFVEQPEDTLPSFFYIVAFDADVEDRRLELKVFNVGAFDEPDRRLEGLMCDCFTNWYDKYFRFEFSAPQDERLVADWWNEHPDLIDYQLVAHKEDQAVVKTMPHHNVAR